MEIPTPEFASSPSLDPIFLHPRYLLRQKMLKVLGRRIDIYDPQERAVMCCLQKTFKLKVDISLYTDDSKRVELLRIQARQIVFPADYDVVEVRSGQRIGALRRKNSHSLVRAAWEVLDVNERVIGMIQEDSMALVRCVFNLIPQSFKFTSIDGRVFGEAREPFYSFSHRMDVHMPKGQDARILDPRMMLAACILLVLIEGRQQ